MTTTRTSPQDGFADGMSKFVEATRHSMTASRLAMAGTAALGAAAYFYFADPHHREAAMNSASKMFDSMRGWWEAPRSTPGEAASAPTGPGIA